MFKRLEIETWLDFVPFVAFFLTFAVFLILSIRALRLRSDEAEHMASLPLDGNPNTTKNHE